MMKATITTAPCKRVTRKSIDFFSPVIKQCIKRKDHANKHIIKSIPRS